MEEFISRSLKTFHSVPISLPVEASGLQTLVSVSLEDLTQVLLPLLFYSSKHLYDHQEIKSRILIGICGPAGSGKSTLASLLVSLGNTLNSADKTLFPTRCALVSGDGYHLPNVELIERNLKSRKGVIETFHAKAFAYDLELLKSNLTMKGQVFNQPPLPPVGPPLSSRSSWADMDVNGTIWLPTYDRAVTHDPLLHSVKIDPECKIVFIEHLFVARGDGKTPLNLSTPRINPVNVSTPRINPVGGPDSESWIRILSLLDDIVLLNVPMTLCRARCLKRRLASSTNEIERDMKLEATARHYATNDAETYNDIILGDITRVSFIIEVPLPDSFLLCKDMDPLQISPASAIDALLKADQSSLFQGAKIMQNEL